MDPREIQAARDAIGILQRDQRAKAEIENYITTGQLPVSQAAIRALNITRLQNQLPPLMPDAGQTPLGGPAGLDEGIPPGGPSAATTVPNSGPLGLGLPPGDQANPVAPPSTAPPSMPGLPVTGAGGASTGTGVDTGNLGFAPGYEGARGGDANSLSAVLSAVLQGLGINQDRPGLFGDIAGDEVKKYLPFYLAMAGKGKAQQAAQNFQGLFAGANPYEGLRTWAQQQAADLGATGEFGEALPDTQQSIFHNLVQGVDAPVNRIAETLHNARLNRIEGQWGRASLTNPQNYADFIRAHLNEMPEYASLLPLLGGGATTP
jgi:hypothetical protein